MKQHLTEEDKQLIARVKGQAPVLSALGAAGAMTTTPEGLVVPQSAVEDTREKRRIMYADWARLRRVMQWASGDANKKDDVGEELAIIVVCKRCKNTPTLEPTRDGRSVLILCKCRVRTVHLTGPGR